MIEGLAFIGVRATWNLQHSATPDAPVVADPRRARRGSDLRALVARALRRSAELLDPGPGRQAICH